MVIRQNLNSKQRVRYLKKNFLQSRYKNFFDLFLSTSNFMQKSLSNSFSQDKNFFNFMQLRKHLNSPHIKVILGFYFKCVKRLAIYSFPFTPKGKIFYKLRQNNFESSYTNLIKKFRRCFNREHKLHKSVRRLRSLLKKFGYSLRNNFISFNNKQKFRLGFKFWGLLKIFYKLEFFKRYLFNVIDKLQAFSKVIYRLKNLRFIKYFHKRNNFSQRKGLIPFNKKLISYLINLVSSSHIRVFDLMLPHLFFYIKKQRNNPSFCRFLAKYSYFAKIAKQRGYKNDFGFGYGLKILKSYTRKWNTKMFSQLRKIKKKLNNNYITHSNISKQLQTLPYSRNEFFSSSIESNKFIRLLIKGTSLFKDNNSFLKDFEFSHLPQNFYFGQYSLLVRNSYLEKISLADVRSLRFQRDVNYLNFWLFSISSNLIKYPEIAIRRYLIVKRRLLKVKSLGLTHLRFLFNYYNSYNFFNYVKPLIDNSYYSRLGGKRRAISPSVADKTMVDSNNDKGKILSPTIKDNWSKEFTEYVPFIPKVKILLNLKGQSGNEELINLAKSEVSLDGAWFIKNVKVSQLKLLSLLSFSLIKRGMKKKSFFIFNSLITLMKFRYKDSYLIEYVKFLTSLRPILYYRNMYVGGKKYKIPLLLDVERGYKMATRWFVRNSIESGKCLDGLFDNINKTLIDQGNLLKMRREYHLISFENKTYIRFLRFFKRGF